MAKIDIKNMWNWASENYQKIHKISPNYIHYGLWMPTEYELRLLGNVKGKRVLDTIYNSIQMTEEVANLLLMVFWLFSFGNKLPDFSLFKRWFVCRRFAALPFICGYHR